MAATAVSAYVEQQIERIATESDPAELLTLRNAYAGASRDRLLGKGDGIVSVEAATDFAFLAEAADEARRRIEAVTQ